MRVLARASSVAALGFAGCATLVSYDDYSRADDPSTQKSDAASIGGSSGFPSGGMGGAPGDATSDGTSAGGAASGGAPSVGGAPSGGASSGGASTGGTASGGTSAGGAPSGGSGGVGGTPPCVTASDCPLPNTCYEMICEDGDCITFPSVPGTFCNGFADQCDGNGYCVDCFDNGGCTECCYCQNNLCVNQ